MEANHDIIGHPGCDHSRFTDFHRTQDFVSNRRNERRLSSRGLRRFRRRQRFIGQWHHRDKRRIEFQCQSASRF